MKYSRPGGMSQNERAATIRRLSGGTTPNASGANQEAPPILHSSEPSPAPKLTDEQAATAEANRQLRDAERQANLEALAAAQPENATDPEDAAHEAATADEPLLD